MSQTRNSSFRIAVFLLTCAVLVVLVIVFDTEAYTRYIHDLPDVSSRHSAHQSNANAANNRDHDGHNGSIMSQNEHQHQHQHQPPYQSFNRTNPHKESWCPFATCHNSPMCTPCNRRYLFILATARSGSTTLLKMLNYLPDVRMSGENRNELFVASTLISNFKGDNTAPLLDQNFDRTEGAYIHNAIPPQAMSCPIQNVINALNPPPKDVQFGVNVTENPSIEQYDRGAIFGLKTNRFQKGRWSVKEAADFLRENFPCSRVVGNIRSDVEAQIKSMDTTFGYGSGNGNGKGNDNEQKDTSEIQKMNSFLVNIVDELGSEMAKMVNMNEWTEDVDILNDVISWLGFRDCKYHALVHENANGYERDHKTRPDIGENCHYAI